MPLNDYYENSAHHLNIAIERTGVDFRSMITSPDGNYYGIPTYNQSLGNETPGKLWINKPWLDTLGLEVPKTTDDLYTVLKAFKEDDPNGNGKDDEIPYLGRPYGFVPNWLQTLAGPFQYIGSSHYMVEDGKIDVWYNTPEFREGLIFVRSLFEEGLMPDFLFTMDATAYNNLCGNEEIPIVGLVDGTSATATMRVEDYLGFGPLVSPDGKSHATFQPSVANIAFMISST